MPERFPQHATPIIKKSFTLSSDEEIAKALKLKSAKLGLEIPAVLTNSTIGKIIGEARTYGNEGTCNNDDTYNDKNKINFEN